MRESEEFPAFTTPQATRRCRCGCEVGLAIPRRLEGNTLVHEPHVVIRVPCDEHREVRRFRAEERAQEQEMPATMSTVEWVVREINKEVG